MITSVYLWMAIGFVLISSACSWYFIKTKTHIAIKFCVVTGLIWYCLALYFGVGNILGWAVEADLPANAKIISARVVEPSNAGPGGMWFWLNEKPQYSKDVMNMLNPKKVFNYTGQRQPKAYLIPYDRELHKKLLEAQKKARQGGILATGAKGVKGKKGKKGGRPGYNYKDKPPFKIINPVEYFPKG